MGSRGETIRVNAVLRIVFECIAIYCNIAICDWILVKGHFIQEYGFLVVKEKINHQKQQETGLYIPGYKRSSHFCSVMIEYKDNKHCNILQYITIYCNVQYINIFLRRIVLYCSRKYCNISIYCNIVSSLICTNMQSLDMQCDRYNVQKLLICHAKTSPEYKKVRPS